ncbi:MAG: GGDEF domain-containing protein [bacterium]|nr:GGDEF domain-containing protein [bacterium]
MQRARRGGERIALVMFDIDYFKQVNDAHTDHQFGDRVLRELCQVILSVLRPFDLLSRYGGEEFVLVLALNDGKDSALTACERVRVAVEEHVFESGLRLTVSMGVAVCPDDGTALEDLIKRSDEAMYRAKAAGRNRVELA